MEASEKPRTYRKAIWTCLTLVLLVPSLYVLSIGPAVWLMANEYISEQPALRFYDPLEEFARSFPVAGEWIRWYVSLWRP